MPKLEPTSGQASKAVVILRGIFPVISKCVREIYFCGRRRLTCIHTIIEWFGFEGALKIIQLRTLCHGQEHLPLHQIAQNERCFCVLLMFWGRKAKLMVAKMWSVLGKCSMSAECCPLCALSFLCALQLGWTCEVLWILATVTMRCGTIKKCRKGSSPIF